MPKEHITIPVFIPHRGCPHTCVFCDQWGATSQTHIPRPEDIGELVRLYTASIKPTVRRVELAFFGGSFTGMDLAVQEAYLSAAAVFYKNNIIHGIRLSTRPDYLSDDILELLARYPVSTIEIGCQSFDDRVLSAARRGHTVDDIYGAVSRVRAHGISFVLQLMPGLPLDSRALSMESARAAADLAPSGVRLYPAVILGGTGLDRLYAEKTYRPLSLAEAVDLCSDMYSLFKSRDIPVLRMGIHPFSEARTSEIIAGPYHPSFGFFVKSHYRRKQMMDRTDLFGPYRGKDIMLFLPRENSEEYIGYKKDNMRYLESHFGLKSIVYAVSDVTEFSVMPGPVHK